MQKFTTFDIENIDQIDFDDFFNEIQSQLSGEGNNIPVPNSKIEARKWIMSYLKMESEIEYLSKEYKDFIKNRYLKPIDDRVECLERSQYFIKENLLKFLENAEIKSVPFPDLATVSKVLGRDKIIYPENEEDFAKTIFDTGCKNFIKEKYILDKNKINKFYNDNDTLPFDGLSIEKATEGLRITKSKTHKELKTNKMEN